MQVKRGRVVHHRRHHGLMTGGVRPCQMEGCRGVRFGVRWQGGKRQLTWPCTAGLNKDWRFHDAKTKED